MLRKIVNTHTASQCFNCKEMSQVMKSKATYRRAISFSDRKSTLADMSEIWVCLCIGFIIFFAKNKITTRHALLTFNQIYCFIGNSITRNLLPFPITVNVLETGLKFRQVAVTSLFCRKPVNHAALIKTPKRSELASITASISEWVGRTIGSHFP